MTEHERPRLSTNELAEDLRNSEDPRGQVLARSVEEMYSSGTYGVAYLRGSSTDTYELDALRVIVRRQDKLEAFYTTFTRSKNAQRRLKNRVHAGMQILPRDVPAEFFSMLSLLRGESMRRVQEAGLQTLAALELGTDRKTQEELFRIIYPKVLMDVTPADVLGAPKEMFAVPQGQQRDLAMAIAFDFLRAIPFERRDISIHTPHRRKSS